MLTFVITLNKNSNLNHQTHIKSENMLALSKSTVPRDSPVTRDVTLDMLLNSIKLMSA